MTVVGFLVGVGSGCSVGATVGTSVGYVVGLSVLGENDGRVADGAGVGLSGSYDGDSVGADVG